MFYLRNLTYFIHVDLMWTNKYKHTEAYNWVHGFVSLLNLSVPQFSNMK